MTKWLDTLEDNVRDLVIEKFDRYLDELQGITEFCRSPIEKMLAIPLYDSVERSKWNHFGDIFDISPQVEVDTGGNKYTVDFMVRFGIQDPEGKNHIFHDFVIECDGHEFHEKTKEQVSKDKQRERDLMKKGYIVIRFSGSDIHNTPEYCAHEAMDIINRFLQDKLRTLRG
ncbi:MAG TPA: DUF559 domain-containing protein [Bacillales bacterium]